MYLSRVEMTGFKSFADKTVIEFDQGMTAVVGPNGSGKSNLSEAIRWVLGEQSAKSLRGNKMEDVIFNGTLARKPVNIAKVTLVLNNEDRYLDLDFSEISISRSINRNGDSQYFINKEACRLKDIVDLLLDSGLGKNSFSIISQGQVEQIFLNKPEERRTIFEEAAGVQKYQYRKTEAERKLSRSQEHLSRVRDIIYELELQLGPLKDQRQKALEYQALKSDLERHEISLYTWQIQETKEAWDQDQADLEAGLKELDQLDGQEDLIQQKIQTSKQELQLLEDKIDANNQAYQAGIQELERLKGQDQLIRHEIKFSQTSQEEKLAIHQDQLAKKDYLLETLSDLSDQASRQDQAKEALLRSIKQVEKDLQHLLGPSQADLEEIRSEMFDLYQARADYKNQVQLLQRNQEEKEAYQARLEDSIGDYQSQVELKQAKFDQLNQEYQALGQDGRKLFDQMTQAESQFKALQETLKQDRTQVFQAERSLSQLVNQVEGLRQHQEDYVGYYPGVRAVMKEDLAGVHGPVADLIKVKESFETAIEIGLGSAWQHLVVDSDQVARQAIQLLKEKSAGRATFLPLSNIKPRYLSQEVFSLAQEARGYLGLGSDFVETNPAYQDIIANLLATTVVMENIQAAQTLARQAHFRLKIVTLDGDLILPGGSITGGKYRKQGQQVLQRQSQIEALEEEIKVKTQALREIETGFDSHQAQYQALELDLQELRTQVSQTEAEYRKLADQCQLAQLDLETSSKQALIDQDALKQVQIDLKDLEDQAGQAQQALEELVIKIEDKQNYLDQANLSQEERQGQIQTKEASLNQARTDLAVLKVEINQTTNRQAELQKDLDQLTQAIDLFHKESQQKDLDINQLRLDLADLEKEIGSLNDQNNHQLSNLNQFKQDRLNLNLTINNLDMDERKLQGQSQEVYQKVAKLEAQIEKHQTFIDNYLTYLNQEYALSFEAAQAKAQEVTSIQESQKLVRQIKQAIEKLGPINLQAIEDYQELDHRYQNLTDQEADLLSAMDQLQATMDDMDQEVIKRFGISFEMINQQFQKSFRRLFAGGQASLELTNPDDLLTTGIDIMAQPPGKKKQHLALLSGGERALTAIALLFAILETKPVPFVVLDEVEAALDEANVYRYGEYIQNFTRQTQFIVITHRKGTMEHADVLYGVTMQQSGISKLASVRLSEAKEGVESSDD